MKWGLSEKSFGCVMGEHGCALLIDNWKVVPLNIIQFLCSAQCSCSFFFHVQSIPSFCLCFSVNELLLLSEDCRYLVLLAKVQSKVNKNDEALLSLQRVS